ncbi:MAG TPA: hypothetical protein VI432_00065 [Candidatus Paceibacterota bacterium]
MRKVSDKQLMFILHLKFTGCFLQELEIFESGNMEIKFVDKGGNFHHQTLNENGTLTTHD